MQYQDSKALLYMEYLLSSFEDSIDNKIDNPPVCFEIFCNKIDINDDLCYNIKKNEETENGFE